MPPFASCIFSPFTIKLLDTAAITLTPLQHSHFSIYCHLPSTPITPLNLFLQRIPPPINSMATSESSPYLTSQQHSTPLYTLLLKTLPSLELLTLYSPQIFPPLCKRYINSSAGLIEYRLHSPTSLTSCHATLKFYAMTHGTSFSSQSKPCSVFPWSLCILFTFIWSVLEVLYIFVMNAPPSAPRAPWISTTNMLIKRYHNCLLSCPRSRRTRPISIFHLVQSCHQSSYEANEVD